MRYKVTPYTMNKISYKGIKPHQRSYLYNFCDGWPRTVSMHAIVKYQTPVHSCRRPYNVEHIKLSTELTTCDINVSKLRIYSVSSVYFTDFICYGHAHYTVSSM